MGVCKACRKRYHFNPKRCSACGSPLKFSTRVAAEEDPAQQAELAVRQTETNIYQQLREVETYVVLLMNMEAAEEAKGRISNARKKLTSLKEKVASFFCRMLDEIKKKVVQGVIWVTEKLEFFANAILKAVSQVRSIVGPARIGIEA